MKDYKGYQYFATIIDDYTLFTWVYMMKCKSKIQSITPCFFAMIETLFNTTIIGFRYDNAKELDFTDCYYKKGVLHQFSWVQQPGQIYVVEKKHQYLLNVSKALFFQPNIPIEYWFVCVL